MIWIGYLYISFICEGVLLLVTGVALSIAHKALKRCDALLKANEQLLIWCEQHAEPGSIPVLMPGESVAIRLRQEGLN